MLLTGLADTEGNVWEMDDAQCSGFITSVCGGGGTEELQIHAFFFFAKSRPRKSVIEWGRGGFRHASVEWKRVDTSMRRRRLEAGHAVINHLWTLASTSRQSHDCIPASANTFACYYLSV